MLRGFSTPQAGFLCCCLFYMLTNALTRCKNHVMSLFNSATPQQIQALARCGTPDMAPLVELLTATVGRLHNSLAVTDTPNAIYRLQGEVTALNDLLLSIKKAPEALARMG